MTRRPASRRSSKIRNPNKRRPLFDAALIGALVVFSYFFFFDQCANFIEVSDEGFLAHGAARTLEGQIPNRDFVSLQPPLSFYSAACAFKLLGTSIHSMRMLGFALHLAVIILMYRICRSFAKPMAAMAATLPAVFIGLPFFSFVPFAVWHGIVFTLGAMFFSLRYWDRQKPYLLFLSGFMTGLAILSRHDQGFYSAIAMASSLFVLSLKKGPENRLSLRKNFYFWIGGILLLLIPFGLWSFYTGSWPSVVQQLILFPMTTYGRTSSIPMPKINLSETLSNNVFTAFFYLPGIVSFSVVLACIIRRGRKAADFPIKHFYIAVLSLLFYMQVTTRSDLNHLIITSPPFFILLGILLSTAIRIFEGAIKRRIPSLSESADSASSFLLCGAYLLLFFAAFSAYQDRLINPPLENKKKISLPRAGVHTDENTCRTIETIVGIIQKYSRKDQSILCLPYQPMIYFLAERRNPTRWNYLWPGDQSEADHLKLIEEAKRDAPALVLLFGREDLRTYAPAIVQYVESSHSLLSEGAGMSLYLPKNRK